MANHSLNPRKHYTLNSCAPSNLQVVNLERLEDLEGPSLDLDLDRDPDLDLRLSRDLLRERDLLRRGERDRDRDLLPYLPPPPPLRKGSV